MASFVDHPEFPKVLPYLFIQEGDPGDLNGPRHRIEVHAAPAWVLRLISKCQGCDRSYNPIRQRQSWSRMYFCATCSLGDKQSMRCRNGKVSDIEAEAVRDAIRGQPTPAMLF